MHGAVRAAVPRKRRSFRKRATRKRTVTKKTTMERKTMDEKGKIGKTRKRI